MQQPCTLSLSHVLTVECRALHKGLERHYLRQDSCETRNPPYPRKKGTVGDICLLPPLADKVIHT